MSKGQQFIEEQHEDADDDPFAAPKKGSRIYQGKGINRPEEHVMTYVLSVALLPMPHLVAYVRFLH